MRTANAVKQARQNLNIRAYLVNANRRPNSELFVIRETNATVDWYRVERPDGQPVRDPRVVEGWVDGRFVRSEQSIMDEDARIRQAEDERRATEQAEQQRRAQLERDNQQARRDAQDRRNSLDPRFWYYRLRDSTTRRFR